MSEFFSNMNLARFIIVATIPLSLGLGWFGYAQAEELKKKERALRTQVAPLVSNTQQLAVEHTRLTKEANKDGLSGQNSPESYIRGIATSDKVEIGDVSITTREISPTKGVTDRVYTIRPTAKGRSYTRPRISNFLFKLEDDSNRIKVTDISIDVAQKNLKPHEVPKDEWTFTAQVTSRQAD